MGVRFPKTLDRGYYVTPHAVINRGIIEQYYTEAFNLLAYLLNLTRRYMHCITMCDCFVVLKMRNVVTFA